MLRKAGDGGVDVPRAAAAGLLLVVAAVGLRSRRELSASPPGPSAASFSNFITGLGVAELLAAVVSFVLLAVVFRGTKRKRPEQAVWPQRRSRLVRLLTFLFTLAVLAGPIALALSHPYHRRLIAHPAPMLRGSPVPAAPHQAHGATAYIPWQVALVLAVSATAAVILLAGPAMRRRSAGGLGQVAAGPAPPPVRLRAAVADAAAALRGPGGPREVIIASYAAMEARLASAGAAPSAADTPAEVLARAAAAGLVRSAAAGTLTAIFRRARYSRHPVGEGDLAAAVGALARLRADLGDLR